MVAVFHWPSVFEALNKRLFKDRTVRIRQPDFDALGAPVPFEPESGYWVRPGG
jgi:hypothetical protein